MNTSLSGLTVVTFEQAVAAPYCTSRLVQDGARVIKVERPEGDFARNYDQAVAGEASYFVWLNAGKESIALDLKDADDLALARSIVTGADILVQNLAPGALARMGVDFARLRKQHPRLITLAISGYGPSGEYAGMKAYDLLIQAESGLCAVTGTPESPARVGISICDIATGLQAYAAILRALVQRGINGLGEHLEISMFEAMLEWMAVPLLQTRDGGATPARIGVAHPSIAPYGVFDTADDHQILIAVQNEREWQALASNILPPGTAGDEKFGDNLRRCRHRAELDALIADVFSAFDLQPLMAKLTKQCIACAQLRTPTEVLAHPALKLAPITVDNCAVQIPGPSGGRRNCRELVVPKLNQHGAALSREFGG